MADGTIGSVAVEVVPDAQNFWRRFETQTRTGAGEAGRRAGNDWRRGFDGETSRPAVLPVRADTTQLRTELGRMRAQFSNLGDLRIDTGSLKAGELASLTSAANNLSDAQERLRLARAELAKVNEKEGRTEAELAAAQRAVTRAERDQELASLRLAASQETVAAAQDRARKASEKQAAAALAAAAASETQTTKLKAQKKETLSLLDGLVALAPALIPLAGAAAVAGGALVALGGTAALVVGGIKRDIKAANAEGLQFAAGLGVLKDDLHGLETTAAHDVLGAFQQAVTKLHGQMPAVNADLAQSSKVLGDIGGHVLSGVLGGFHTFAPALLSMETQVDHLAGSFESWATGPGGTRFAASLSEDFQHVVPLLENLSGAIAHVVAAGNVPGLAIVDELNTFSKVLEAIPTPVLTGLISGLVALKTATLVSGLMDKLAVSIRGVAAAEGEAAAASTARGGLAKGIGFVGKIGAAYLGAMVGIDAYAKATDGARTSSDLLSRTAAQTGHALDELVHLDVKGFFGYLTGGAAKEDQIARQNGELATSYRKITGQLGFFAPAAAEAASRTKALNAHQVDLVASLAAGHGVFDKLTVGEEIASERTKDLAQNTKALAGVFNELHGKLGGGAEITKVSAGYSQASQAIEANIAAGEKFVKLGGEVQDKYHGVNITLDMYKVALAKTGSDSGAVGYIQAQIDALGKNKTALQELAAESANVATYISDAGTKYKLTSDQIDVYTAALGLNIAEIAKGGPALRAAEADLKLFVGALKNGNTAIGGWLVAVAQFAKSSDTAADRASLIGSALVAANGDMLAYQNTIVGAAQANQQLVTDFVNLKKGVLDLKTGAIDFHNAAAAPLLGDLQNLQTAAMNSAAATYQHFNAIGDATAADKAFATYVDDTRGALLGQATQLGLTHRQAKKLADQYFGIKNSGDLKKQIELIGQDKVLTALQGILDDLDILAGKHVKSFVDIETTLTNAPGVSGSRSARAAADGAIITEGTGPRADDVLIRVSKGEAVIPADQVQKHNGMVRALISRTQGFAGGGVIGNPPNPFSGVDYSGNANKNGVAKTVKKGPGPTYTVAGQTYSSFQAAENAAKRLFKAQVTLGVKIDDKDLTSFRAALSGTVSQAKSAFQTLYDDAKKLGISDKLAAALRAENKRLDSVIGDREHAKDRLKKVTDEFVQVRDSVSQAGQGAFDVTSAGAGFDGQQAVTFDSLQAQQSQAKRLVEAWAAGIKRLGKTFGKTKTGQQLLEQLASGGPSDYPEVKALLSATPKDLANFVSTERQINATSGGLGNYVGNTLYGGQIAGLQKEIRVDNASVKALGKEIAHQVHEIVREDERRPIVIKIGSQEIARVTAQGAKINARRS